MKTKNSMNGFYNLIDNISFEDNPNVDRASDAVVAAQQEFRPDCLGLFYGWIAGFDEDNGNVAVFLPLYDLWKFTDEECKSFYEIIRKKFVKENFEILQEEDLGGNVYFHVGFASHSFILKSLV